MPAAFRVLDERTARELIGEARNCVAGTRRRRRHAACCGHRLSCDASERLPAGTNSRRRARRRPGQAGTHSSAKDEWARLLRTAHGAAPGDTPKLVATEFVATLDVAALGEIAAWLAQGGAGDAKRAAALSIAAQSGDTEARFEAMREALLTKEGVLFAKARHQEVGRCAARSSGGAGGFGRAVLGIRGSYARGACGDAVRSGAEHRGCGARGLCRREAGAQRAGLRRSDRARRTGCYKRAARPGCSTSSTAASTIS